MNYLPHTDDERDAMLNVIGARSLDALFDDLPKRLAFPDLDLPQPCSEIEICFVLRNRRRACDDTPEFDGDSA